MGTTEKFSAKALSRVMGPTYGWKQTPNLGYFSNVAGKKSRSPLFNDDYESVQNLPLSADAGLVQEVYKNESKLLSVC